MRLLRSVEEAPADGATVPIRTLAVLARRWYGDRLDPDWRPRPVDQSQRLLDEAGLTGEFWRLG